MPHDPLATATRVLRAALAVSSAALILGCGTSVSPTANEVCEAVQRCSPSLAIMECGQTVVDEAERLGCVSEVNAANLCTVDAFDAAADAGACDAVALTPCGVAYASLSDCFRAMGGVTDFACDAISSGAGRCVEYIGNVNGPGALCGALDATVVTACPTEDVVGRCVVDTLGSISTTTYYQPLAPALTIDRLESLCTGLDGVWTAGS